MKHKSLNPRLESLAKQISDENLRKKVVDLLRNPTFNIDGKNHSGLPFDVSPAGKSNHHSYPGGYIEHVASTANIALTLCNCVEKIYSGKVNRDLILAGVLLHDAFKPVTYAINENGSYDSSSLGDYLDHLSIATGELTRRGFPLEIVHIVAAHHGSYGPIRPHSIEALICHLADLADSRLNREILSAASYYTRKAVGQELFELNSKEAFEIVRSRTASGWSGVAKTVEKIRQQRKTHKTQ
jgi:7,8-dihydroneopterin 2',3'-cyclic phosphate phosphodiesterase